MTFVLATLIFLMVGRPGERDTMARATARKMDHMTCRRALAGLTSVAMLGSRGLARDWLCFA